jgi:hypothetical protein
VNEDRAQEGIEHLQAAARELIGAARAFLDVAEDLVQEPGPLLAVLSSLGDLAGPLVARGRAAAGTDVGVDAEDPPERAPRVQHIRVS